MSDHAVIASPLTCKSTRTQYQYSRRPEDTNQPKPTNTNLPTYSNTTYPIYPVPYPTYSVPTLYPYIIYLKYFYLIYNNYLTYPLQPTYPVNTTLAWLTSRKLSVYTIWKLKPINHTKEK